LFQITKCLNSLFSSFITNHSMSEFSIFRSCYKLLNVYLNSSFSGFIFEQKVKPSGQTSQFGDLGYRRSGEVSCLRTHLLQRRQWSSTGNNSSIKNKILVKALKVKGSILVTILQLKNKILVKALKVNAYFKTLFQNILR